MAEKVTTLTELKEKMKKVDSLKIAEADKILQKYKDGKSNLDQRVIKNDKWYQMRVEPEENSDLQSTSDNKTAWLFNSLANKHADILDNFPEINVLPREQSDEKEAEALGQILPVILERCNFENTYSEVSWEKIKNGTGVYGVFWNSDLNGIGDVDIREINILSLFWEPGITNIQDSQNVFHVKLENNNVLESIYPELKDKLGASGLQINKYHNDDTIDTSDKTPVIDWYYKRRVENREIVHYCKYCNGVVLYASEDDSKYSERGFYDHGKYPFVFDVCFPLKDTPYGFGFVDIMSGTQENIDGLTNSVVKNAKRGTTPRYFINSSGAVNEDEFADWSKNFVHVSGSNLGEDSIREIKAPALDANYLSVLEMQKEELKEVSGNRDFSQGSTVSGVTAASAIAALQEAGGKLTRDLVKGGYRAFMQVNELALELIRQFYDTERSFRIIGPNDESEFVNFNNKDIKVQQTQMLGIEGMSYRLPIFDLKVVPSKSSAYSRLSQNELALQLYNAGMFNPENADRARATVTMMNFTGKQQVLKTINDNGTIYETVQALAPLALEYAKIVDSEQNNGGEMTRKIATILQNVQGISQPLSAQTQPVDNSLEAQARRRTNEATTPK